LALAQVAFWSAAYQTYPAGHPCYILPGLTFKKFFTLTTECLPYEREEKYIEDFDGETLTKEAAWKTCG
jgi:hypothetical protein